ncbi:TIGR03943 family putative permease subunit [Paenibacillus montanisoli]|uniref:TIGR03943 family protein n=1 Tax=Paenibacillus montanisoli TaxID=2081970 RepID=A0A328U761_9BACL|nr:TIGR03943 family protein [Paenibacillus montanisoli]RAP78360.1 TIGR03943 family protein [Paenibacillus montanisoli]
MIRLYILAGFACLFIMMHLGGNLNKYINVKYAYLSESAIVLLIVLFIFEFVRLYVKEREESRRKSHLLPRDAKHMEHPHDRCEHGHHGDHDHDDHGHFGHSHEQPVRWKRVVSYGILIFPLLTGFFLPVQTLDSSFVKAKGFSFPGFGASADNPGNHQFLKPDSSIFYGKQGYAKVSEQELREFLPLKEVKLTDANYLKGLEAIYNFPDAFATRKLSFEGFVYRGEQTEDNQFFVFRFGFIHCVADSGVFGMLADFPKGTAFRDDQWVRVTGTLAWSFYQPFKQTIPMLKVTEWTIIPKPKDPYVYRA